MFVRFFYFLRGYVSVCAHGFFLERFLNLCVKKEIGLWDVLSDGENKIRFKMTVNGFKAIREPSRKTRTKVKIEKRGGLPFLIQKCKKRKSFVAGILIAVILFFTLSCFIWRIDVEGNEKVSETVILESLSELGFRVGSPRFGNDVSFLQNEILKTQKELSWIWVDIKGTRAVVSVRERVAAPEFTDDSIPSNLVAAKSGLVTRVTALNGEAAVSVGDTVDEGSLLISGICNLGEAGEKYTAARGEVTARTWYSANGEFPLVKTEYVRTGKKTLRNTIKVFGVEILSGEKKKIPFEHCDIEQKNMQFGNGKNFFLPIFRTKTVYYEKNKIETKLTTDAALVYYGNILRKKLDGEKGKDAEIVDEKVIHSVNKDGKIYMEIVYECVENIGKSVKIENGG